VPYYQRIYVMYGRWPEWVAKAYLRSGDAFEQLGDRDAARRTYQEMIGNEALNDQPEAGEARGRLEKFGGTHPNSPDA
ncbi:MAG: tetratricopeptide repeat protein, partial [Chthoniobacteraceae bacterium]